MNPAKSLLFKLSLLLIAVYIVGCTAAKPETPLQTVYVAKEALAVYGTWIVGEHDLGKLQGERYKRARAIFEGTRTSLTAAQHSAVQGDSDAFIVAMTAANQGLAELARYKGGAE